MLITEAVPLYDGFPYEHFYSSLYLKAVFSRWHLSDHVQHQSTGSYSMHNPEVTLAHTIHSTINLSCGRQLGGNTVQEQHKQRNQIEKPQHEG